MGANKELKKPISFYIRDTTERQIIAAMLVLLRSDDKHKQAFKTMLNIK